MFQHKTRRRGRVFALGAVTVGLIAAGCSSDDVAASFDTGDRCYDHHTGSWVEDAARSGSG